MGERVEGDWVAIQAWIYHGSLQNSEPPLQASVVWRRSTDKMLSQPLAALPSYDSKSTVSYGAI